MSPFIPQMLGSLCSETDHIKSTWQASLEHSSEQPGCNEAMKKTNRTIVDNGSGFLFCGENHSLVISKWGVGRGDNFEQDQSQTEETLHGLPKHLMANCGGWNKVREKALL